MISGIKSLAVPLTAVLLGFIVLTAGCERADENAGTEVETAAQSRPDVNAEAAPRPTTIPAPADVAAVPADAERSESGLAWKILRPGTGTQHPGPASRVEVHYTGWTTDGTMFDSSLVRGATATFPVNRVITGWTEGLQLMVEGEQRRFWIPPELAYKNSNRPGAPQGMLVFDVELIGIRD